MRPLASLLLLLATPAFAQSQGCIERPVGPTMDITVLLPKPRAAVTLPNQPMHGTGCVAIAPPPRDVLRGEPPPAGGLLRDPAPWR